ncbi:UNVERIFIED_CONTAM: lia operon protein LiaG [Paenibacillus sp. PvR008]
MGKWRNKGVTLLCVSMLVVIVAGCNSDSDAKSEVKTFNSDNIKEIYVQTDSQNIELSRSSNEQIEVRSTDKGITAVNEGGALKVNAPGSSSIFNLKTNTVYVALPNRLYDKVNLTTKSGKITGKDSKSKELNVSGDSSSIDIQGFEGEKIVSHMSAGDINLVGISGAMEVSVDAGNINISHQGEIAQDSSVKSNSGKIELKLDPAPSSLRINAVTNSGEIESSLKSSSDPSGSDKELHAQIGKVTDGSPVLSLETSSGTIVIE